MAINSVPFQKLADIVLFSLRNGGRVLRTGSGEDAVRDLTFHSFFAALVRITNLGEYTNMFNKHPRVSNMPGDRDERIALIQSRRWSDLELIVEQVDDPHNVGAILRTCDAVGIQTVHLVYAKDKQVRLSELRSTSAASAVKWLTLKKWDSLEECYKDVKSRGLKVCVTALDPKGKAHFDLDFKTPCAILMGNEKDGATQYAIQNADEIIAIPMRGFVQSLNVSVAAAVVMYEALRQHALYP